MRALQVLLRKTLKLVRELQLSASVPALTVTVWLQLAILPQASVAFQVLVTTNAPQRPVWLVTVPVVTTVTVPQESLADG
jgi:hypothetical protein